MGNRKEEILIVALHLFARDGYEAVSVSQIAGELDMTKGALYRHYKSKRDIFDSIVKRMEQQDSEQARENEVPEESIEKTPEEYQNNKPGVTTSSLYSASSDVYQPERLISKSLPLSSFEPRSCPISTLPYAASSATRKGANAVTSPPKPIHQALARVSVESSGTEEAGSRPAAMLAPRLLFHGLLLLYVG